MQTLNIQNTNNIDSHKLNIIQWITNLDDFAIIRQLEELKTRNSNQVIDKAEEQSVLTGIQDAQNGRLNPHSEAYKIYGKSRTTRITNSFFI